MHKPTLLGSIAALMFSPLLVGMNAYLATSNNPADTHNQQLAESLSMLGQTLASLESRQTGSATQFNSQIDELAKIVAETQRANRTQIEQLTQTLDSVRTVAMQAKEADYTDAFSELLGEFEDRFSKRVDTKISSEVNSLVAQIDKAIDNSIGVGTLDTSTMSDEEAESVRSIQTLPDAARRIIALEKEVAALKARSASSSTTASTSSVPVYYSTPVYSGNSSGTSASYTYAGGSTGSAYSYSAPTYYSAPTATGRYRATSNARPRLFGGFRSGQTCRIVNGIQICN